MANDNILNFPTHLRDAIDENQWQLLQGNFYLDCFYAHHGYPSDNPDQLREWLQQAQLYADMENPFFRGWLVRRLNEETLPSR